MRHSLQPFLLDAGREGRARRQDPPQAGDVDLPFEVIEGVDEWATERVADDHEEVHAVSSDQPPDAEGIELAMSKRMTAPPPKRVRIANQLAVPCINGHTGRQRIGRSDTR